uniref:FAS1 domain-containing protein n=1 Tax=Chromera velia CCMP2878 TaxID=1169474 RepID=A0A0G4H7G9_9ALVE|mmetsp:Transcript_25614/g.50117  ORF Transcript_25614/g.50117 Transcript_25614/m.50117 type:complete len:192 (-) Transcript_25614:186-761(-)|eukprot:Cvel_5831.t1-p1 / transcript=Cvel_5831.t1 / gene=Cvel_5831 / organism=Chromera_velia_CCMP2878 / gene_product=hypothetical protein / transcript_product=hypothetical protein / location=Cvel_scaffold277:30907-32512(+) / protein_length=191 / sequence_SO=supercontig / SO=protein_coding / is_pseudo=false
MKFVAAVSLCVSAVSAFTLPSSNLRASRPSRSSLNMANVVDVIKGNPSLSVFAKSLDDSGLSSELSGAGPYTVFAFTDDSFRKLKKSEQKKWEEYSDPKVVKDTMMYLVVEKKVSTDDKGYHDVMYQRVNKEELADWPSGNVPIMIRTTPKKAYVNSAEIMERNIEADNGMVHVLGRVLFPYVHDQAGWGH